MKLLKPFAVSVAGSLLFGLVYTVSAQQGPGSQSSETVAKPRKKSPTGDTDTPPEPDQPKIQSKFPKKGKDLPEGTPTFRADVTSVTVDVAVLDNKGRFIPNIPRNKFRIYEDNVPQQVSEFNAKGEAPLTVCMVIEFSNLNQQYWSYTWYQTLQASYGFIDTLKPDDYVAIVAYDLRPEILSDFTTDRQQTHEAMARLRIAAFREANLYDAVTETADRMVDIEGRKAIVLISSGIDTFSKLTFDKTRRKLQEAGVPIYAIGLMQAMREIYDARGMMGPIARLDYLQADNQMRTFAKETGGQSFFPRFEGEFPSIFRSIQEALRNQYVLGYHPSNTVKDGKFRRIKVELVDPDTNQPLRIVDEKGKPLKYSVVAKNGYTAPREVE
jgi:Ca-activated chloride channel homolog